LGGLGVVMKLWHSVNLLRKLLFINITMDS
jgi:hypothetical protein